eukprot:JP446650.1.p1 GENE.JP446650.1~~JP446650.1.p1  ORF type:complete len:256 (+),score=39.39 JP446650.1:83-850(+)
MTLAAHGMVAVSPNTFALVGGAFQLEAFQTAVYFGVVDGVSSGSAQVVGDPLVTGFRGQTFHLHGDPGVYTLMQTPWFALNVLIDYNINGPPEDQFVITHATVLFLKDKEIYGHVLFDEQEVHATLPHTLMNVGNSTRNALTVSLPAGFSVTVKRQHLDAVFDRRQGISQYNFLFLDVSVHTFSPGSLQSATGLLAETAQPWPISATQGLLDHPYTYLRGSSLDYYSTGGNLFACVNNGDLLSQRAAQLEQPALV